jgi:hypothetical protein
MTITVTKPAPAPAATAIATGPVSRAVFTPDAGCVAVSLSGRLRLPSTDIAAGTAAMNRRTRTGTIYRIDLDRGITCWLDGDHHDGSGELNWVATQICAELSGGTFTDPWDAPFVCGPALFTATGATGPVALSEEQLRRVVDAHAAASIDGPWQMAFDDADESAPARS